MPTILVDGLSFDFPVSWKATKYDDWAFYKNQFIKMNNEIKAVDIAAVNDVDQTRTLWLIEVKDYRINLRQNPTPLHEDVWKKVYDSLAGLFAAKCNAVDEEQAFAKVTRQAYKIRVVLHIESQQHESRLFQQKFFFSDITSKLHKKIKPIAPHPLVVSRTSMPNHLQWSVRSVP